MSQIIDDRYRVDARLGEGAQATVLRVHDLHTGRDVALKRLLPAYAQKRKLRARFEAEAKTLSTLDHPNVVKVLDVATDGAEPYFVMELVEGGSLVERLERDGPMPPRLAVGVVLQVCHGLAAAHQVGIIHRDVKPHNVLVGLDGTCKLTDFGIARMGETGLRTRAGAALGTEGFMAPEQAADAASVDVRADVYGVGMTLFVLLTGDDPWVWISLRGRPRVPELLWPVLERATEEHARDRHPNVQSLAEDLRSRLDALPPDPPGGKWVLSATPEGAMSPVREPGPDPLPAEPTMDEALDPTDEPSLDPASGAPPGAPPTAGLATADQVTAPPVATPPTRASAIVTLPILDLPGPAGEVRERPPATRPDWVPLAAAAVLFVTGLLAVVGVVVLGLMLIR